MNAAINTTPELLDEPLGDLRANITGITTSRFCNTWIIDTGATNHMKSNIDWLDNLLPCHSTSSFVQLHNGDKSRVTHMGSYRFSSTHVFKNVILVPEF